MTLSAFRIFCLGIHYDKIQTWNLTRFLKSWIWIFVAFWKLQEKKIVAIFTQNYPKSVFLNPHSHSSWESAWRIQLSVIEKVCSEIHVASHLLWYVCKCKWSSHCTYLVLCSISSPFRYHTSWGGGLPPIDRHTNSTFCPRRRISFFGS